MIEKSMRTFSEKTTSVEHDIERSQKGVLRALMRPGGRVIVIPTSLTDPKHLVINPLNDRAARTFVAGRQWFCDLKLSHASNASVSAALRRSASTTSAASVRLSDSLVLINRDLYIAVGSPTATQSASVSLVTGSSSLFKKLDEFSGNAKKFLRVSVSRATLANILFAYEVRGY